MIGVLGFWGDEGPESLAIFIANEFVILFG